MREIVSSQSSCVAIGPSSASGISTCRSIVAKMAGVDDGAARLPAGVQAPAPTRKRAASSIGRSVALNPIRVTGALQARTNAPRKSTGGNLACFRRWNGFHPESACGLPESPRRPLSDVSSMYRDSGVVIQMWGGFRARAWRSRAGVSPVRTAIRISGRIQTSLSRRAPMISCSGIERFLWMSLDSAFKGDTYTTCAESGNAPRTAA